MPEPSGAARRLIFMNRKRWAPVAAVGAVLAVLIGISVFSDNGRAEGPPVLRLAAADGSYAAAAVGAHGSYRLIGKLPDGPSEARLRDLPATAVPVARVRALAVALGETAAPIRVDGRWKAGDLVVTDEPGNPWTWGATCRPVTPVSSDGGVAKDLSAPKCPDGGGSSGTGSIAGGRLTCIVTVGGTGCSVPGSVGTPGSAPSPGTRVMPPPLPLPMPMPPAPAPAPNRVLLSESQGLTATATLRHSLGLGDAPTRVEGLSVVVEPLAGGLPTSGMATRFQLSSQGRLVSATGSLSIGQEGALYPLRTARKAFDDIPILQLGVPCDAGGCPEGPAVTGARLGLSRVTLDKGAVALVPAWLFTVQGSPVPLVALAVADRFLGGPDPVRTGPGTGPGTIEPDPNVSVAPPPPASGKPTGPQDREGFAFDAAYADADPSVLVVRYGDSGSCPSQAVRHDVVEQPDRVVVTLTRTPIPADRACTMDYQAKLVRITLSAPLGSREVVDGSRKVPVPISTGSLPFG